MLEVKEAFERAESHALLAERNVKENLSLAEAHAAVSLAFSAIANARGTWRNANR